MRKHRNISNIANKQHKHKQYTWTEHFPIYVRVKEKKRNCDGLLLPWLYAPIADMTSSSLKYIKIRCQEYLIDLEYSIRIHFYLPRCFITWLTFFLPTLYCFFLEFKLNFLLWERKYRGGGHRFWSHTPWIWILLHHFLTVIKEI